MRPADMYSDDEFFEDDLYYFSVDTPMGREKRDEDYWASMMALPGGDPWQAGAEDLMDPKVAFHRAAEQSELEVMAILLRTGASVDQSDVDEWTPLMKACCRGNAEVVDFLLCNGADPNVQKNSFTPLMACCVHSRVEEEGRVQCVQKLLAKGVNINMRDKFGMTALMIACSSGLDAVVAQLLLNHHIDINLQDDEGWNALFHAVNGNFRFIAVRLMNAGINLKTVDVKGMTAIELADSKGYGDIVEVLSPTNKENEAEPMVRHLGEPLMEFLLQMPDVNGDGGFYTDVRDLFVGLGMEKVYDRCKITVGMHDFLTMGEDLKELGIKPGPVRWKIKTLGIHRYHVYPWKKSSLHTIDRDSKFNFEDAINCLANVTKHLAVMCATLKYLKLRIPLRVKGNTSIHKDVISSLVNSYVELAEVQKNLMRIIEISQKVRPIEGEEVDLVRYNDKPKPKPSSNLRCWHVLLAGSALAFLYYKLR